MLPNLIILYYIFSIVLLPIKQDRYFAIASVALIQLSKTSSVFHGWAGQTGELVTSKYTKKQKNHTLISQQPLNNKF